MAKYNFCLGLTEDFGLPIEEQIEKLKPYGFDAFFTHYSKDVEKYREAAEKYGVTYQSLHAPTANADKMWQSGDVAKAAQKELLDCISVCVQNEIPTLVIHPFTPNGRPYTPTSQGIENFMPIIEDAAAFDVTIAFENVQGFPYLEALMGAFSYCDIAKFCWNSGHEQCFNQYFDMLSLYGDRLACINLNDNNGIVGSKISRKDDLHLIPFDGIVDWSSVAQRVKNCSYDGFLTFEINKKGVSSENGIVTYEDMPFSKFLDSIFLRACRLRSLINSAKD